VADVLKFFKMLRQSYNKSSRSSRIITWPFPKLSIASGVNVSQMVLLLTTDVEHWLPNTRQANEWQEGHPSTSCSHPWTPNNPSCKCFQPFIGFQFFWFLMLKTDPNRTKLVRFEPVLGLVPVILTRNTIFLFIWIFWLKLDQTRPWTPLLHVRAYHSFLIGYHLMSKIII